MPGIAEPFSIRGSAIKNRLAMLALTTFSFAGENGDYYGRQHVDHYIARAKGGAGLIITQSTRVGGIASGGGMWTPGSREALRKIAEGCREHGAVALIQLSGEPQDINALSTEELLAIQEEFRLATLESARLGFGGVEFHGCHGYFLCSLLDARNNRRTDRFGGDAVARASFLTAILPLIRAEAPEDFIIALRMGTEYPGKEDALELAAIFKAAGVDLFDITHGMKRPEGPAPQGFTSLTAALGSEFRAAANVPLIVCAGIRGAADAAHLLENDLADFAGIGRGMLADPDFANHALGTGEIVSCRACARCMWYTDHTKCPANQG